MSKAARNYAAYAVLGACLIAVHFIIAAFPGATRSASQAAVFSWLGLAIIVPLGFAGVLCLNLTPLRGLWDAELSTSAKVWRPLTIGVLIGALMTGTDMLTGWTRIVAARMHLPSIHIDFPLSVPIYLGGAILVSVLYFLTLLPFLYWLIAVRLRQNRRESLTFWLIAAPFVLVEPLTNRPGGFGELDWRMLAGLLEDVLLNFTQIWFLRSAGFVAAVLVRGGFYAIWHVLYGLIS
jgi:hypothetical protein